jgi:hypothetical protein
VRCLSPTRILIDLGLVGTGKLLAKAYVGSVGAGALTSSGGSDGFGRVVSVGGARVGGGLGGGPTAAAETPAAVVNSRPIATSWLGRSRIGRTARDLLFSGVLRGADVANVFPSMDIGLAQGDSTAIVDTAAGLYSAPAPLVEAPAPLVEAPAPLVEAPAPLVEAPASAVQAPVASPPLASAPIAAISSKAIPAASLAGPLIPLGYRPGAGERLVTRDQWKQFSSQIRQDNEINRAFSEDSAFQVSGLTEFDRMLRSNSNISVPSFESHVPNGYRTNSKREI